ncbi:hypothetical protein SHKM778_43280 [Streptomyces sp. KM77-8]|uniref:Uncharacterized protein n=1 Tax=Streptomyces haneummycinicus TaxID=3074435 RepID=A0AAT9HKG2_9ACTN
MLADQYGYQVSRRAAASWVGARLRGSRQTSLRVALSGVGLLALLATEVSLLAASAWPFGTNAAIFVAVPLLMLGVILAAAGWVQCAEVTKGLRIASAHPFQAWPCQLERTADGKRLILLLAPDGTVVREMESVVPERVWRSLSDGRGVLWIAGDLRMECLVATPSSAEETWLAEVRPYGVSSGAGRSGGGTRAVEDEILRTVAGETFRGFLGN